MNIAKPPFHHNFVSPTSNTILIVIGYWMGDREFCREMVRLMVDLQPKHAEEACQVLLVSRQDTPVDQEMLQLLKTRFITEGRLATSPLRGYPGGSNGVFGTTANSIAISDRKPDCWFWMEPDCVPMRPFWWKELHEEWNRRKGGVKVMGWKGDANGNGTGWHITGCALYDPNIARIISGISTCDMIPWDYQFRAKMLAVGQETHLIHLCWRARNATADLLDKPWAVAHGYKDSSLLRLVRDKHLTNHN